MFAGDYRPMALKKLQNFKEYAALYPEYSFVFIGDNGQGPSASLALRCCLPSLCLLARACRSSRVRMCARSHSLSFVHTHVHDVHARMQAT